MRDRYHAVCDERNAYQHMQFEMTGAIDQASTLRKMSEREREELERLLANANQQFLDARAVVQNMLVIMGITEEEMSKLSDVGKMGQRLKISIAKMKESYERRLEEALEQQEELKQHHQHIYQEMEKRIEQEQQARKNVEVLLSKDRKEYQHQLHELETHLETIQLNFQMAIAGKTSLEAKNTTLSDQKRVLVKEVKHLRKKLEDSQSTNEDVKAMNEKLSSAANALYQQLQEAKERIEQQEEALEKAHVALAKATAGPSMASTGLGLSNVQGDGEEGEVRSGESSPSRPRFESRDSDFTREQVQELLQFNTHLMTSLAAKEKEGGESDSPVSATEKPAGEEADRLAWDMPQGSLKNLSWLSEEQTMLMNQRLASSEGAASGGHAGASRSHQASSPFHGNEGESSGATSSSTPATAASSASTASAGQRRSSMSMFLGATKAMASSTSLLGSSMSASLSSAGSGGAGQAHSTAAQGSGGGSSASGSAPAKRGSMFSSLLGSSSVTSAFSSSTASHAAPTVSTSSNEEPEDRMPSSLRMHCLRCQGTVEGPKYSTCRCSIPALLPEDLHSSSGGGMRMLSGFLSKGSNVAGELAGGFAKVAAHGMGSFISTTSAAMSSHGESSHTAPHAPATPAGHAASSTGVPATPAYIFSPAHPASPPQSQASGLDSAGESSEEQPSASSDAPLPVGEAVVAAAAASDEPQSEGSTREEASASAVAALKNDEDDEDTV